MKIAIFLFDGVTAHDAVGVYDPLARLPDTDIMFVSETGELCRTGDGCLSLAPAAAIGDVGSTDILLVPGGSADGVRRCMGSEMLRSHLIRIDRTTASPRPYARDR